MSRDVREPSATGSAAYKPAATGYQDAIQGSPSKDRILLGSHLSIGQVRSQARCAAHPDFGGRVSHGSSFGSFYFLGVLHVQPPERSRLSDCRHRNLFPAQRLMPQSQSTRHHNKAVVSGNLRSVSQPTVIWHSTCPYRPTFSPSHARRGRESSRRDRPGFSSPLFWSVLGIGACGGVLEGSPTRALQLTVSSFGSGNAPSTIYLIPPLQKRG